MLFLLRWPPCSCNLMSTSTKFSSLSSITTSPASSLGRVAKLASCVLSTSRATSLDDTTTSGVSPSWSIISGPCTAARSLSARCASFPARWCMLPITGSLHGPGGVGAAAAACFFPLLTTASLTIWSTATASAERRSAWRGRASAPAPRRRRAAGACASTRRTARRGCRRRRRARPRRRAASGGWRSWRRASSAPPAPPPWTTPPPAASRRAGASSAGRARRRGP
ncbi:Os02g0217250 [Oryza sativa Japonica Group]|uniref:Os02g0217250 protein n=1 Tax=Oryza sativa subsp. japonica TaxID=39947 RepID=A0A0P0VGF7_ORYSJ|nr:hypothetical protein EE612_009782 [Oryza sativa]BAS77659.1 Os02g0217250 [Oryza sativa Japonica Group]